VPSLLHTRGNPTQRQPGRGEVQEDDLNAVTRSLPPPHMLEVTETAERRFKGKIHSLPCQPLQLHEKQPPRRYRGQFRPQRRQAAGNEGSVNEMYNSALVWQELIGKRCLA